MDDNQAARDHLEAALRTAGVTWKEASLATGRNHAYVQQFIRLGKPPYLPEQMRLELERLYGIDGAPLRPPAVRRDGPVLAIQDQLGRLDAKLVRQIAHDPQQRLLQERWAKLSDIQRQTVMDVMDGLIAVKAQRAPRIAKVA